MNTVVSTAATAGTMSRAVGQTRAQAVGDRAPDERADAADQHDDAPS